MPMIAEVVVPESSVDAIEAAISGLAALATVELRDNPAIPSLVDAAARGLVVYRKEAPEAQTWLTPSQVLARGHGDCKHFSAWRTAELRNQGRKAMVAVVDRRDDEHPGRFHAIVEHDQGADDPSLEVIAIERARKQGARIANVGGQAMRTEFKIKPEGRGHKAAVAVPVGPGSMLAFASVGDTRADALDRVMQTVDSILQDPIMLALVPAPAVAAIQGVKVIAHEARQGTLDDLMHRVTDPVQRRIATVLQAEMNKPRDARTSTASTSARSSSGGKRSPMDDLGDPIVAVRGGTCTWRSPDGSTYSGQCPAGTAPPVHAPATSGARPTSRGTVQRDRFGNPIGGASYHPGAPSSSAPLSTARSRGGGIAPASPSGRTSGTIGPHAAPLVDPATGQPWVDPTTGQPYTAQDVQDGMLDPSGQYVWRAMPVGHWERARASDLQPDPSLDPAGYYDPSNPDGYYGGGAPPSPSYPYDFDPYGWADQDADPWGAWSFGLDPYVYPGAQPFSPSGGYGDPSNGPAWATSLYPPPFGDHGVEMPEPSTSAWYAQGATEAMFNGGAVYPEDSWADQFGYGDNGFMADVACVDPEHADLVACARENGWTEEQPHATASLVDVASVDDIADVE